MNKTELIHKFDEHIKANPLANNLIVYCNKLPDNIINNVNELVVTLSSLPAITSVEACAEANKKLGEAKRLIKKVEDAGLEMRRPINDICKDISAHEKDILAALAPLVAIINSNITNFQREQDRKAKQEAERIRLENEKNMLIEQQRVTTIKNKIYTLQNNILGALSSTTDIEELTKSKGKVEALKFSVDIYQEFISEVESMRDQCVEKFADKIKQLADIDAAKKDDGIDDAIAIGLLKAREEQEVHEAITNTARDIDNSTINIAANSQMKTELQTSQVKGAQSVQRRMVLKNIIDIKLVPREYLIVDEKKVKEAIKKGVIDIPGLQIEEDISNVSR